MIFYGTKATNLKNGQIINVDCPNCETNVTMKYSVFGKYAHIYWIPLFPTSKITVAECNSCKKTFEYKELPESIKTKFEREKEKNPVNFPVWMFSGCFVIAALVGFGVYKSNETEKNEAEYIKNPKVGDVYCIKVSDAHFTCSRVDKIVKDSLFLTDNDYETDQTTGIDEIDIAKNYTNQKETLSKKEVQDAYKSEKIFAINRK
ncbi:zinc-ribbon domain-containing protein [Flavobacterium sp. SUN052]|uniref:zinc-ribbon domain-containing protein n=1 Tax=Flavobacterium sp. SUN052 TaxID=3002441 RepID=UPI00237DE973|nr:zinc-ribbon domain-containing protein [Flavobacterium sp. SUN052]MEC4005667.1 zinc-ribbon domain-containing protein [Flavobacterium sp. SUN052]